jgi:acyl dehydratase
MQAVPGAVTETCEISKGPITRTQLALFAGASGDHNPIHLDDAAAMDGGLPGVIAHGMLNMAFLGELLTAMTDLADIRQFEARFVAMSRPGDIILCRAEPGEILEKAGERLQTFRLSGSNATGQVVIEGRASIAVSARPASPAGDLS